MMDRKNPRMAVRNKDRHDWPLYILCAVACIACGFAFDYALTHSPLLR